MKRPLQMFVLGVVFVISPQRVRAQEGFSVPAKPGAVGIGISYGWTGGLTRGASGAMETREYPTVLSVIKGSVAARAGLRVGDTIISVNGRDGRHPPILRNPRPGEMVEIRIRRGDEERELSMRVEKPAG